MSTTFTIFLVLIILVAFLLVVVIMVQNPKGGGLSSSFGGGGTNQLGGVQKTTDFLDKSTWTLATLLLVLVLLSNIAIFDGNQTGESRIIDGETTTQPAQQQTTIPPATQAPGASPVETTDN